MRGINKSQRGPEERSVRLHHLFKSDGGEGCGRDSVLQFQGAATFGDRRYASRSASHSENDRVALFLDFFPKVFGVVPENETGLSPQDGVHGRHVVGKP